MQILLFILCLFTCIFAQDPPISYDASFTLDEDNQINIDTLKTYFYTRHLTEFKKTIFKI
mgnify:CR=1 FL=1